jgi:hypothetical protein
MDINADTEFLYTYVSADGTLASLKKRFRVSEQGPTIRGSDGATLTATPQAGSQLIVPKPKDIPWFDKADWQSVAATAGEALPALLKRAQSDGAFKGRVLHHDAAMTPGYVWFDWRNWQVRKDVLGHSGTNNADAPETDVDPTHVQFQGGENVSLPLKAVKQAELPVAPGKPGGTAPSGNVDVSDDDFTKLQTKLWQIEDSLNALANLRARAVTVHAQLQRWLTDFAAMRSKAMDVDTIWKQMVPPDGGDRGSRQEFIGSIAALLEKASPALLNGSAVAKLEPTLPNDFKAQIESLRQLITDRDTTRLLASVIPFKGDAPWVHRQAAVTPQADTVDHLCRLATLTAFWIGEAAPRDAAIELVESAMNAMGSGAAPSADAKSILDFAVAIPFYPPEENADDPDSQSPSPKFNTTSPIACAGAVTQTFLSLAIAADAANGSASKTVVALPTVANGLGKVMSTWGWSTFKDDFQKLVDASFKAVPEFTKLYSPVSTQQDGVEQGENEDRGMDAKRAAFSAAEESKQNEFAGARIGIQAKNRFGEKKMKEAFEAVEAVENPHARFPGQFKTFEGGAGALWALGVVVLKVAGDLSTVGETNVSTTKNTMDTEKATIDTVKDVAEGLSKLKVIASVEMEELAFMLGRVSLILGIALEACDLVEAAQAGDVVGFSAHLSVAIGMCFMLAGSAGPAAVVIGVAFLAVGTAVLVVRSDFWQTEVAIAFRSLFPDKPKGETFESKCREPFELGSLIDRIKSAFANANFSVTDASVAGFGRSGAAAVP